jgi:predicted nucleic acid-binding protein
MVLPVVEEDGWQARRIVNAYAASLGVGVLDAFIAATALREGLVLSTPNDRHFRGIAGLQVERPY